MNFNPKSCQYFNGMEIWLYIRSISQIKINFCYKKTTCTRVYNFSELYDLELYILNVALDLDCSH